MELNNLIYEQCLEKKDFFLNKWIYRIFLTYDKKEFLVLNIAKCNLDIVENTYPNHKKL